MALSTFFVGSTVTFTATFTNKDGTPFNPALVGIGIDFSMGGSDYRIETGMLAEGEGVFTFAWDTEWIDPGVVRWDVRNAEQPVTVTAGRFIMKRSAAAPQPLS